MIKKNKRKMQNGRTLHRIIFVQEYLVVLKFCCLPDTATDFLGNSARIARITSPIGTAKIINGHNRNINKKKQITAIKTSHFDK